MIRVIPFLTYFSIFMCISASFFATDYVWVGSDNSWTTTTNWSPNGTPSGINDSVTLNGGSQNLTIPAGTLIGSITLSTTYDGTVTMAGAVTIDGSGTESGDLVMSSATATAIFNCAGYDLTILNDFTLSHANSTFTAGNGLVVVSGDFSHTAGTFTASAGTVMFGGASDRTITLSGGTTFNNVVINDGLVGYWKCDETSGGIAADSSGYGHNGTHEGNPTANTTVLPSVNFKNTACIEMDGTGDFIRTSGLDKELNYFSISAFINVDNITGIKCIISKQAGTGTAREFLFVNDAIIAGNIGGNAIILAPSAAATTWYHVAITYDDNGGSGVVKAYLDGDLKNTISSTEEDATGDFLIGMNQDESGHGFVGKFDDVRIYDRVLSDSEITALANGNQPGTSVSTTTLSDTLDVNGELSLSAGTLSPGSNTITVSGDWTNYGGVFTSGTSSVTLDGVLGTFALQPGGQNFNNLYVNDGGGGTSTVTLDSALGVSGFLNIHDGVLNSQNNYNINVSGDWTLQTAGTFTAGSSTVTLDGTSAQTVSGSNSFYNFQYNGTSYAALSSNMTFSNKLIIGKGAVTAGSVTLTMGSSADFRIGQGSSSKAIVSFDGTIVTTDSATSKEYFTMSVRDGGDITAKKQTQFNFLDNGIVFYSGSRMGSNSNGNFRHVTFDSIDANEYGLDFKELGASDANNFPDVLLEIRFVSIDGTSGSNNVTADQTTPTFEFRLITGNYGSVATDGESGDTDASSKITWTTSGTWVSLSEFKALGAKTGNGVDVSWKTTGEFDNQGFNIYRSNERYGAYYKINSSLIKPPDGETQTLLGHDYQYFDPVPKRGKTVYYKLEDIDVNGTRTFHGPISVDWDRDGLPDDWELANGLDPLNPDDASKDPDGDGLTNLQEYNYGFDPQSSDTDQDGILDGSEDLNTWQGPQIPGVNVGGSGLEIVGKDHLGKA